MLLSVPDYTLLVITYLLFFILLYICKRKKANRLFNKKSLATDLNLLILLHIAGILLFGLSVIFSDFVKIFAFGSVLSVSILIIIFLGIYFIFFSINQANVHYLQMTRTIVKTPSNLFFILYFPLRILFIFAYESWFRGYLLHESISDFGMPAAVILNVTVYTLLHIVNEKKEIIACIPFGTLLCLLCIWQDAAWPAIVLHLAFTIPYEICVIKKIVCYKSHVYESNDNGSIRLCRQ